MKRLEIHTWLKNKKTAGLLILVILLLSFAVTLAYYNDVLTLANPWELPTAGRPWWKALTRKARSCPGRQ